MTSIERNIKLRESQTLSRVLGEQVVATLGGLEWSWFLASTLTVLVFVAALVLTVTLTHDAGVYLPLFLAFVIVNAAVQSLQKVCFVGVTERSIGVTQRPFYLYILTLFVNRPARRMFTAPLAAAHVTARSHPLGWSVRYDGPGPRGQSLRLQVGNRSFGDLEEVLAALRAGGASVDGLPGE